MGENQLKSQNNKKIIYSPQTTKRDWIVIVLMIITIIVSFWNPYGINFINSFAKQEYNINLINGGHFEGEDYEMSENDYIKFSQDLNLKQKKDEFIFNLKITHIRQNYPSNYSIHFLIIDPLNKIRGDKEIEIKNCETEIKKIRINYNPPINEEKLFGEWKIISIIENGNQTYSVLSQQEEIIPETKTSPWIYTIFIIIFLLLNIPLIIKLINKKLYKNKGGKNNATT